MDNAVENLISPNYLFIELTNHCNMHCTFCPSDELEKPRQHVEDAHVREFLRQVSTLGIRAPVQFNVLGEPLLNKKIYDYIGLCEELGHDVILITNVSLLTEERLEKIFSHHNVVLVMSVQTPTAESYELRRYPKLDSDTYLSMVERAIRAKFAHRSRSRIEVHLAAELEEDSASRDEANRLWQIFRDERERAEFLSSYVSRLQQLALELEREFPDFYSDQQRQWVAAYQAKVDENVVEVAPSSIVDPATHAFTSPFWGWMFASNAFLRIKRFGMWAKQEPFIRKHLNPGEVFYIEERLEPMACPMATNLSMLADGSFSLCCLDYEGEMKIGSIRDSNAVETALRDPRRIATVANAMTQQICRRCTGNLFIFDTAALARNSQNVEKFGAGWHPFEPDLHGRGGRWTTGHANSYVLPRLAPTALRIEFYSPFPDSQEFALDIEEHVSHDQFALVSRQYFQGEQYSIREVTIPFNGNPFRIYRVVITCPTLVPRDVYGTQDTRQLGLAILNMTVVGEPVQQGQYSRQTELVQLHAAEALTGATRN